MRGTLTEIVVDRGFGFIDGEDGHRYFFHRNALDGVDFGDLGAGTTVEFGVQHAGEGSAEGDRPDEHPRAVNVRLAPDAVPAADHEALPLEKIGA
jgi:cold shock CspA family protein